MILAAFAFLAGVLALLASPAEPKTVMSASVALALLVGAGFWRHRVARISFWGSCGFLFAALHAHHHLQGVWPQTQAGERVLAKAWVESIPVVRGDAWTFDARIRIQAPAQHRRTLKARLTSRDPAMRPRVAECWTLIIALSPPRAALNPGAVDFERLLFHDRIQAMGAVVPSRLNHRLEPSRPALDVLRDRVARHIESTVTDREAAALITALAVGVTGVMSTEQWRVFNVTGTTHLIAISGMHVTMLAIGALIATRWLWRILIWRWVPWTRENFAAILGLIAATGYAFLAGFSVPTQRTLIMLAAWLLARSLARETPPLQPFAIALLAVLLLDPFAPLAAGFWLSFGAMGAILFIAQTRITPRTALNEAVAVQLAVAAVLVPLTLAYFGSISLLGPIVNAFAIPYISWALVPTILLALTLMPMSSWASDLMLGLAAWLHDFAWPWLVLAADAPLALAHATPPIWWYALAAIAIIALLLPLPLRLRAAAVIGVLPLVVADHHSPSDGAVEITALDVGQGTAVVVRTARYTVVFGTGESYGTEGRRVESVLLPFLRSRGVRVVDTLIVGDITRITATGLTSLLATMPVRQILLGDAGAADFPGARICRKGETWFRDGVRLQMRESCQLHVAARSGELEVTRASLHVRDRAGHDWVVVSGRSERPSREVRGVVSSRQATTRVIATGDVGAVRLVIDPTDGVMGPEGLRSVRRAIWRAGVTHTVP